MIISHVSIIMKQLEFTAHIFVGQEDNYNKQNNTWMFGNAKFISRVEQDISLVRFAHLRDTLVNTRNKFHISSHPGIILYLIQGEHFNATINIVPLKKRIFLAKKTTNLLSKIHLSLKT